MISSLFFFLMIRQPPSSTLTDTLFPYTTLFRSLGFVLLGLILARKYKELGLNTISGVLASRYGQNTRIAASVLTICALEIIAVSIYARGGAVLSGILAIGKIGRESYRERVWTYV